MSASNITHHRRTATSITSRLAALTLPAGLKPAAKRFTAAATDFVKAAEHVDAADMARDLALQDVSSADAELDAKIDTLVDLLPGAGLGTRQKPLKSFSTYSPTDLKALPFAKEPEEVASIVAGIQRMKPPANVSAACKACLTSGSAVKGKLKTYGAAQSAYVAALAARDELLPTLLKATRSLKTQAAAAWEDDKPKLKALFAAPDRVEAPKKARKKKASADA